LHTLERRREYVCPNQPQLERLRALRLKRDFVSICNLIVGLIVFESPLDLRAAFAPLSSLSLNYESAANGLILVRRQSWESNRD